jgi:integrase
MRNIVRPKIKNEYKEFINFYTKEELNRFLQCAKIYDQKAYTLFRLLAYTGLRRGEALALKWSDIDLKNKTIGIERTLSRGLDNRKIIQTPKTNSSFREVTIDSVTVGILQQWQQQQRKQLVVINIDQNQFVFTKGMTNKPLDETTPVRWNEAICKLGHLRKISIHGFRHTNASLLFEAGVSMKDVQTRLGHKSIKTTMDVYTHVSKRHQNKAVEQLSNYMNG